MNFFKSFGKDNASTGQGGKTKLFGGMKIKGPTGNKQQKQKQHVTQSQTNLSFVQNKSQIQQQKTYHATTDDISYPKKQTNFKKKNDEYIQENLHKKRSSKEVEAEKSSVQVQEDQVKIQEKEQIKKVMSEPEHQIIAKKQQNQSKQDESPKTQSLKNQKQVQQHELSKSIQNQLRIRKPSSSNKQKNPFLNQIKKNTTVKPSKDVQSQKKQLQSVIKPVIVKKKQSQAKQQKQSILNEYTQCHKKLLQSIIKKKQAKQLIINLSATISQLKEEISVNLNKQCHYVELEQYQQADKIQQQNQNLTAKIQQHQIQLNYTQEQFYKIQYQMLNAIKIQAEDQRRLIRKIKLVELELDDQLAHYKREQEQKIQTQKTVNQNQKKKISRIVTDIKNQAQQITQYQKTFNEDLNSRKDPLLRSLQEQTTKKNQLQKEIKQLQEKLTKKKNELKTTTSNIDSIQLRITEVDMTFQEEAVKLQQRKSNLKTLQIQKQDMSKKLQHMEEKVKKMVKNMQGEISKIQQQKKQLINLSKQIQKSSSIENDPQNDDSLQTKKVNLDNFIHNTKILKQYQEKHKEEKQKVKDLQFKKANLSSQVSKNQDKIKELKQKIPALQLEQKSMVNLKNFKGANMKKNQIKQAQEHIQSLKKKIEQCYSQENKLDQQILQFQNKQSVFVDQENQIRKNLAISQYRFDLDKLSQIKMEKQWLEKFGPLEMINKFSSILEEDIQNLIEQIKYIEEQYNLAQKKLKQDKKVSKEQDLKPIISKKVSQQPIKQEKNNLEHQIQKNINNSESVADEKRIQNDNKNQEQVQQYVQRYVEIQQGQQVIQLQEDHKNEEVQKQYQQQNKKQTQNNEQSHQQEVHHKNEEHEHESEEEGSGYVPLQLD